MARYTVAGNAMKVTQQQSGFSYLAMLFLIAALSVVLTKTYERSDTIAKRDKEKELFFIGNQYRQAIMSYYNQSPGGFKELPKELDDLLSDNRFVGTKRHLRKRFMDPVTGEDFSVLLDESERIKGISSTSNAEILQLTLFDDENAKHPAQEKAVVGIYSDVKFEYVQVDEQEDAGDGDLQEGLLISEESNDF